MTTKVKVALVVVTAFVLAGCGVLALVILLVVGAIGATNTLAVGSGACTGVGAPVEASGDLPPAVGRWQGEQLRIAAVIVQAGVARGVPLHGQTIAVMTGMGESSLTNVDYGDDRFGVRNPDGSLTSSLGVFQQQKWWGTREQRLDPAWAAGEFYARLINVPGWAEMAPTLAAHAVQRNANPFHYERWWMDAQQVVAAVTGAAVPASGSAPCAVAEPSQISVGLDGWVNPAQGRVSSGFGRRNTGIAGASTFHEGTDIANVCRTPVHAAQAGTVVHAGPTGGAGGNMVGIDHGGVVTRYKHLLTGTIQVSVGQQVPAGAVLAGIGGDRELDPAGSGASSGCHLHVEVRVNGTAVDPVPYFRDRGIELGR